MLSEQLGASIAALPAELDAELQHAATRALVDWAGAVVIGTHHPAPTALRAALLPLIGEGGCSAVGTRRRVDPRTAALINATAAHAIEVDDIYRDGIYHPGAPTIAAAVAAVQLRGGDGMDLLRALTAGFEVGCRVAAVMVPSHYRYWHTTGTVGTLGAAAAVAAAERLEPVQAAHAIAIAATLAAGLQQSFRSEAMAKPLHAGHAADAGLLAGLSAGAGFTGALDVIEGEAGLAAAMSEGVDWTRVAAPWRHPFCVEQITIKNHTGCGHTFAPVDATLRLRFAHDLTPAKVASILIETAATPIKVAGNRMPTTAFEAKFSIPYCVGAALQLGSVRLAAFNAASLEDPTIRSLMARTTLEVDPEFDATFPSQRAARVSIRTTSGDVVTDEALTRHGDPEDLLSDEELSDKFLELTTPALGGGAEDLLRNLWGIADAKSIETLLETGS